VNANIIEGVTMEAIGQYGCACASAPPDAAMAAA
jgi:hypothetical protein